MSTTDGPLVGPIPRPPSVPWTDRLKDLLGKAAKKSDELDAKIFHALLALSGAIFDFLRTLTGKPSFRTALTTLSWAMVVFPPTWTILAFVAYQVVILSVPFVMTSLCGVVCVMAVRDINKETTP